MMHDPLISIITVVYNGGSTLEKTIQSVINQTYSNIEYIIIDGGSTDNSVEIIKKYSGSINQWISEKDKGLYDAMNKGIKLAKGELVGMINSDDWYELDAISIVVKEYLKNHDKDIFHANRFNVLPNGEKVNYRFNPSIIKFLFVGMTYNHPSMFVKRSHYSLHKYNIELTALSDYQFVLEAFYLDASKFHFIDASYVNYRLDGLSSQMNLKDRLREGFLSRKLSGMNLFFNIISLITRFVIICLINFQKRFFYNS